MPIKDWALSYARLGWPVFRITGYKTPLKGSHGHLDATTDLATIERWWTEKPHANVAVALGDVVVVDADGPVALERLQRIMTAHGGAPRTAVAQTSRGLHFYFRAPPGVHVRTRNEPREKSGDDGIDIKAHGGWTVLPPSVNAKSKFVYRWISLLPLAELPMWLLNELTQNTGNINKNGLVRLDLGALPAHLNSQNTKDVGHLVASALKPHWNSVEEARIISALSVIPPHSYDVWMQVGMILKDLGWERSDGTDAGFDMFDEWSQRSAEKYSFAATESKWNSFGKRGGLTIGSLFHLAQQHGWQGGAEPPKQPGLNGTANGVNGHHALPAAFLNPAQGAIHFPDLTEDGKPRSTCTNAGVAVKALGIVCKKDLFHEKMLVAGEPINAWAGDMSDDVIQMIRKAIRAHYGFDPNDKNTRDACTQLCLENQFDPVCDYLASLQWDGKPRLDRWMADYLGAGDTELNRAIGRLSLIAAVRRARQPGTKFDQIVVLEGTEGRGKSTALEILAGRENFSDQKVLDLPDKEQQEAMCGIWIYEIAELTGMRRAATEHVKAFASRTVDRARPAYGRYRIDRPRRAICFATTNDDEYLKSETGNRRFWPVVTGHIDLDGLRADRDQLWAEAAMLEARGESIGLPEQLWKHASAEQHARLESDVWTEAIQNYLALGKDDVSVWEVLTENQFLRLEAARVGRSEQMRAAAILRRLHFEKYRRWTPGKAPEWRYKSPQT